MSAVAIAICVAVLTALGAVWWMIDRRMRHKLAQENEQRERLGLAPLSQSEYKVQIVEKSAEFRGNLNQHM